MNNKGAVQALKWKCHQRGKSIKSEKSYTLWLCLNFKCEVWLWSMKCEVWSLYFVVWTMKFDVLSVKFAVWSLNCEVQSVKFEVWLVKSELWFLFWYTKNECAYQPAQSQNLFSVFVVCLIISSTCYSYRLFARNKGAYQSSQPCRLIARKI